MTTYTKEKIEQIIKQIIEELEVTKDVLGDVLIEMRETTSYDHLTDLMLENKDMDYELQHLLKVIEAVQGYTQEKIQISELLNIIYPLKMEVLETYKKRIGNLV